MVTIDDKCRLIEIDNVTQMFKLLLNYEGSGFDTYALRLKEEGPFGGEQYLLLSYSELFTEDSRMNGALPN